MHSTSLWVKFFIWSFLPCGIWSFDYFPEMTSEIFLELLGMQKSTIFFITETPNDQMFLQSIQGEYFLRFDRLPSVGNCYNQSTSWLNEIFPQEIWEWNQLHPHIPQETLQRHSLVFLSFPLMLLLAVCS